MDHPRVGGEKMQDINNKLAALGSPPHGRGKAFSVLRRQFRFRITPAWAGKRWVEKKPCLWYTDHPRAGGEKSPGRALRCCIRGSPPRGRGKETRPLLCRFSSGITPAWAGKSRPVSPPHRPHRDHPRMGGEKRQALSAAHGSAGSPPRGRGKIHGVACHIDAVGITPAWAGKRASMTPTATTTPDHPRMGGEKG